MKIGRVLILLLVAGWVGSPLWAQGEHAAPNRVTAIRFGTLIPEDGSGKALKNAVVVVTGGRIKSVSAGEAPVPAGGKVVVDRTWGGWARGTAGRKHGYQVGSN